MHTRLFRILSGVLMIYVLTGCVILAQQEPIDINSLDLGNINVDEINDDQIRLIVEKMEQNGISQQEIEMVALAKGMSKSDIQKLLLRMNTVKSLGSKKSVGIINDRSRGKPLDVKGPELKPENVLSLLLSGGTDSLRFEEDPRKRIFGFSLFNSTYLTFEPSLNIPTPAGYILGPGDEVIIDVWGASQNNYSLVISPEGNIFLDKIGSVFLSGLTIEEGTSRIRSRLSSIYSGLKGGSPNTFMQVSIGDLRSIKVTMLG
ncbi:MAG TPA: polysaccharide biosynthesis/export family protein, partial [Bacteroidales bacterium]|nr:polysaccharide biosynthesis/export family protein [Bacteroidales bacterium]